jgi:hypothetical protein
MTKTTAEQILIQDCFATPNGKKAAIKLLASKGATILNDKYLMLDGTQYQILIDNRVGVLTLKAFKGE